MNKVIDGREYFPEVSRTDVMKKRKQVASEAVYLACLKKDPAGTRKHKLGKAVELIQDLFQNNLDVLHASTQKDKFGWGGGTHDDTTENKRFLSSVEKFLPTMISKEGGFSFPDSLPDLVSEIREAVEGPLESILVVNSDY